MNHISALLCALLMLAGPASIFALDDATGPKPPETPSESIAQPQERPQPAVPPLLLPTLADPADPSGFFFAAEQLRQQSKDAGLSDAQRQSVEFMYSLAFRFAKGPAAQEAGKSLYALLSDQSRYVEAASIAREWIQQFGADWAMYRNIYDALAAQNDYADALSLVAELAKALPSLAKSRATELAWMEYNARVGMQDYAWAANGPPFIKTKYPDTYTSKIFRLYAAWPNAPQDLAALALFRAATNEKKYADAATSALSILPVFSTPDAPRVWISELGKSLYGAGAWQQGLAFFSAALGVPTANGVPAETAESSGLSAPAASSAIPALDRTRIASENLWVMAFYLARMYQGVKDNQTAASIYIELVPLAFSDDDSDSALWYWLDITMDTIADTDPLLGDLGQDDANAMHAKRALEISALTQASALWKKPSYFEDIVSNYMRRLLREGGWDDVVRLCALMSQKLTSAMRGPLLYLSGRLIETGRSTLDLFSESGFWKWLDPQTAATPDGAAQPANGQTASLYYRALLRENGIEDHYRTLAAWRLGIEPPVLTNAPVLGQDFDVGKTIAGFYPDTQDPPVSDDKLKDMLDFIGQSLDYGLESLAANQVAALSPFSTDALMWLAMKFIQHDQYYPALRIGREALNRKTATKPEIGYALLYPRAWPEHFAELSAPRNIAEPLAYAIVRSESLFNQRAVSRSGAMGLSQLLPGTAAETAKGLKMSQYALFDPEDNLTIGLTYYGYMLQRFNNRPTRAIAAYNAGPSRMAQWAKDWGSLDDDILIELYPVEEPRQYTKNITAAALFYGKLYYGISAKDMLDFIYGVKPLPQPSAPPASGATPTQIAPAIPGPTSSTPDTNGR